MYHKLSYIFINLSIFCSLFFTTVSLASFSPKEKKPENERVAAQSSRGCPKRLGNIIIEPTSKDTIEFNNLTPKVPLNIKKSPTESHQDIFVALIDNNSDQQVFSSRHKFTGSGILAIQLPSLKNNYQYVFVAQIVCNENRPSSNKSLRILLKTNANKKIFSPN
jgi:hypothetical protein